MALIFTAPALSGSLSPSGKFISLSLDEAIKTALERNRGLWVAANSVENSSLSLENAWSAFDLKYTPSVLSGVNNDNKTSGAGISLKKKLTTGPVFSLTPYVRHTDYSDTLKVSMGLTVPLLGGFGKDVNMASVYSSQFGLRDSKRSQYLSKVNTILSTVSYAFRIDEQKKLVALYQKRKASLSAYTLGTMVKKKAGLATPMDEFRTRIFLKDVEDQLSQSRNNLSGLEEDFKKLLAIHPEDSFSVQIPDTLPSSDVSLDKAISTALENRVEIRHAQDFLSEKIRQMDLAEKNLLPDLNLVLSYQRYGSSDEFDEMLALDEDYYSIQLTSSTDWSRTSEKIAYRKSQISVENAKTDITLIKDTIIADVKQAFRANQKNLERMEIQKEQIHQAMQKLKLSTIKYQHEMADNFDVIESEREIQQAQADLLSVKTAYCVGVYQLREAMGTLLKRK